MHAHPSTVTDATEDDLDAAELAAEHDLSARDALALRSPAVPVSVNELAAMRGAALEILETRILLLETARKRAIRLTAPQDWTLNVAPTGAVTGYLEDAGCHRLRDPLGVQVYNVTKERIPTADGKAFMWAFTADGRSTFTLQVVEQVEGGRSSDEDFFVRQKLSPGVLDLKVRKAGRANVNGRICRELCGLSKVALEDIVAAWVGTDKDIKLCNKGHGYGSGDERVGAAKANEPDVPPPPCPVCPPVNGVAVKTVYKDSARGGFYYCPRWKSHPPDANRVTIDAKKWEAEVKAQANDAREPGADG